MTKLRIFNKLIVLVCITFFTGCAGNRSILGKNEHYPSISVEMFHNDTFQPGLEEKLTNTLIEEILADSRLKVENEGNSEITLKGNIRKYTRTILSIDGNDNVTLYQMAISTDIVILDTKSKTTVTRLPDMGMTTTYVPLRSSIEYETESEAQKRVLEDLSSEIVYQLIERDKKILTNKTPQGDK